MRNSSPAIFFGVKIVAQAVTGPGLVVLLDADRAGGNDVARDAV